VYPNKRLVYSGKGQAAALDLALFASICILALAFLSIQSAKSAGSTGFIEENENMNEVAVRMLSALAQSRGELEIRTLQTAALKRVDSCLSDDIQTVMSYADKVIDTLSDIEKKAASGDAYDVQKDPFVTYLTSRLDAIDTYILNMSTLVKQAIAELEETSPELKTVCAALEAISGLMPGYDDVHMSCSDNPVTDFLDDMSNNILSAADLSSIFEEQLLEQLDSAISGTGEADPELAQTVRRIRCYLEGIKESANSLLSYLESGIDPGVSFLELLPVNANLEGMTLEKILSDAITIKGNFVYGDETASVAGSAALILLRGRNLGEVLPEVDSSDSQEDVEGIEERREHVILIPREPLVSKTNTSAEGPYQEFFFSPETYLTSSGLLAVRLSIYGIGLGGVKHNTEYFEMSARILNYSAYSNSQHYRTYNGSFIDGKGIEDRVTITTREWAQEELTSPEISSTVQYREDKILRPMEAQLALIFENLTYPQGIYNFDIEHYCITRYANHTVNTSGRNCSRYNESDAEKAILLGVITAQRGGLMDSARAAVESRLEELLWGYSYKFELRDCCGMVFEINPELEPVGREGVAKRYFEADGKRAEMKLTVWRD